MKATVLDEQGKEQTMIMGCYGIGVSRIVAAAIEQNNDDNGMLWPDAIAPYHIALLPMNMKKSQRIRDAANSLYEELQSAGFEVLLDDRPVRPGVMFSEMELIGIPHRIVIGEKNLDQGRLEYKSRRAAQSRDIPRADIISFLNTQIRKS
jgi:prolyl-tRNA synthetase